MSLNILEDSLKELLSVNTVSGSELSGSNKVYQIFSHILIYGPLDGNDWRNDALLCVV